MTMKSIRNSTCTAIINYLHIIPICYWNDYHFLTLFPFSPGLPGGPMSPAGAIVWVYPKYADKYY